MADAYLKVKDNNGTLSLIREAADGSFADLKNVLFTETADAYMWMVGGLNAIGGGETSVTNRIRTVEFLKNVYGIDQTSGYSTIVFIYDYTTLDANGKYTYVGQWDGSTIYTGTGAKWLTGKTMFAGLSASYCVRLCTKNASSSTMTASEGANVTILRSLDTDINEIDSKINEIEYEIKTYSHGVSELLLKWKGNINSLYADGRPYTTSDNKTATTELMPIPESGVYIYTETLAWFKVHFWKIQSGSFVAATDYLYCWSANGATVSESWGKYARYYPYAEGVYFTITMYDTAGANPDAAKFHCVCGKITDNGGRLPNLSPVTVFLKHASGSIGNQSLVFYNSWGWYRLDPNDDVVNSLESRSKYYLSILRIQDINRIVIAPPYSGAARIYKVNNDSKQIVGQKELIAPLASSVTNPLITNIHGVSTIDVSDCDYNGFVLLVIVPETNEYAASSYTSYRIKSNGMLNAYDDVYDHVYVEWKPGVSVAYDSGIPATAKNNINTIIENTFAADLMASPTEGGYGNYGNPDVKIPFPAMGHVTGWWYNASNCYNVPHMHVNPKSYITASKNHHSRVYVPTFPGAPTNTKNNLYGSVCSSIAGYICGAPTGLECIAVGSRLFPNMEYRDYLGLDDIRAGDFVAASNLPDPPASTYGHIVYCAERVTINGELFCVNVFEGAMPWTGYRTFINLDAYDGYTFPTYQYDVNVNSLMTHMSNRYLEDYENVTLARLAPKSYHSVRDAYGEYDTQDYSVTAIMCDRGTDSVYCIGELMQLFVTDGTTSIDLHKDGSSVGTVDLTSYPAETYTDGKVYNVTGMVDSTGYYEIYAGGSKAESFYVPPDRTVEASLEDSETCRIKFEPDEENDVVVAIDVRYYSSSKSNYEMPVGYYENIDSTTTDGSGLCTFNAPRYVTLFDNVVRGAINVGVVRRTPFGTYQTKRWIYEAASNPGYRQRAGLLLTQESENG